MAAQDFFVMHGEKVVVGVVGAACAYLILNAFTNDGIRPMGGEGGISATTIKDDITFIDGYRPKAKEPILKPVPDYAGRMKNDFTRIIPSPQLMAWVTAHPDMGQRIGDNQSGGEVLSFIYVYELLAPTLTVKDAIGSFEVGVTVAPPQRTAERLVDKDEVTWQRKATEGTIDSSADIVGALIERQVGKGPWEPVNDGKLLAFSDFKTGISIPTVDYETYAFRARLVARATGYGFGAPGGEVMVANGRWIGLDAEPTEADFLKLMGAVNQRNQAVLSKFIRPTRDNPALSSVELKGRENLYVGPQNDATVLRAQSAVKFQLLKLDPDPADPSKSTATLLLTKLFRANGKEGWVEMQQYKTLKPGMKLGDDTRKLDDPTDDEALKVPLDLSTPFELVRVDKDVKRVYYHELKLVARKDGKPGKEFELRSKEKTTDTATFKNTRTGEILVVAKLERLTRPNSPDAMITPDLVPVDEKEEFEKDPGAFAQQELLPALPIMHQPDTGPLEDLFKKGKKSAKTDTPYYEMPDGRLYYYEPNNKLVPPDVWKLGVTPKPKVELPKPEPKATPAPTPVPTGAGHKPTTPEPGMPPGGPESMPHDGMPPGVMPGGQGVPGGPGVPGVPSTGQPTPPRRR
jgi:hypothetical protein